VGPFGYRNKAEFEAAIQRELDEMAYHQTGGREPTNPPPKPRAEPTFKSRGAPDSPERWQQAIELVGGDPQIVAGAVYDRVTGELNAAIRAVHQAEETGYDQRTLDQFAAAVRHLAATGDPDLYAAFEEAIEYTEAAEHLPGAVQFAQYQQASADVDAAVAMEQDRLNQRHQLLESEYEAIHKRTGPDGLAAADYLTRELGDLAYGADEDQLRATLRSTAEQVAATERGLRQGAFLKAFDDEAARKWGPAGNDAEREKWETELRNGSVEIVERAFGDPEDAADRAVDSMIRDDRRAANKGKSDLEVALDAELAEQYTHSRQGSPHLRRLADIAVEEFEQTHDELGRRTTRTDALGRESERRGERR
jgi:hypothetical protein